jgi:hypothetical protein
MKLRAVSSEWFSVALPVRSCVLTWSCNKCQHETHGITGHMHNTARCSGRFCFFPFLFLSSFPFAFLFLHTPISLLFLSFLHAVLYSSFVFLQFYISLFLSIPILISFWCIGRIKRPHTSSLDIRLSFCTPVILICRL